MSVFKLINSIRSGNISESELEEYLNYNNVFVLSNTMREIVKKNVATSSVKSKLLELCKKRTNDQIILGLYTVGHLAMATLVKIGVDREEISEYMNLDEFDKKMVDNLIESYNDVID